MTEFHVLIVEDDADLREALRETLELDDINVSVAADGPKALELLEHTAVSLVVSDIQMQPWDGLELVTRIKLRHPGIPVVLMTAFGSVPQAVQAIREGAIDYLVKPVSSAELLDMVRRFDAPAVESEGLVAEDPRSRELLGLATRVAHADISVLLSGPSGSGKEAYARFIHAESDRAGQPFVAVNCAAIPEHMLEAELFGHEKGAFTGATQARIGKFEHADGGTLLLDEISEMDLSLQAKLLRVLQEREIERLGGNRTIGLDVRVIATTNRDLPAEVAAGRFREDLFYRLNVFPLNLPPLSERPGDIEPLARRSLLRHWRGRAARPSLTTEALQRLLEHHWPGNVRELDNVIQRALVLAGESSEIGPAELYFETVPGSATAANSPRPATENLHEAVEDRESDVILAALQAEGGHRGRTARRLGISPRTLRYKLSRMRDAGLNIPGKAGPQFAASGR
ncbi:sigma-54-dependent Fis family transcriptional regulator [Wenzhouxiangella sp. AB-CW3]|uniref:sigma-54-dependent transcriptional regulator n=1 Tax=Wenzhouxiangella sp. AB-CW3 TaxID=2771012 RepID=UPI00168A52DC|nr:sigma-54 dependent transcriptional regulator [Wenzhouxiangella sp. AB-CW3]QOC21206.1 sigma-54-dependent Fis family transcriptional regulator [Wenzhouxiangella sp. AB-CW3]